jgi:hypothetical protein
VAEIIATLAQQLDPALAAILTKASTEANDLPAFTAGDPCDFGGPAANLLRSVAIADYAETPFRHWQLQGVLPESLRRGLLELPVTSPGSGRGGRLHFDPDACTAYAECASAVEIFADPRVIDTLEQLCGVHLSGSYLRLGCHVDTAGFSVGPHCELAAKLLTIEIHLHKDNPAEDLGSDLFDAAGRSVVRVWSEPNCALVYAPAGNTWHGFQPRRITGQRKVLVVNYVTAAWRAKHELACRIPGIAWRPGGR